MIHSAYHDRKLWLETYSSQLKPCSLVLLFMLQFKISSIFEFKEIKMESRLLVPLTTKIAL
jgi:hypothetical protein